MIPDTDIFETVTLVFEGGSERVDIFTASELGITRSRAQKMIADGLVTVNGRTAAKNRILAPGDTVEADIPENREYDAEPEDIPLDIRYEDQSIIVVNKPKGMVVHPAPGHLTGTLVNALLFHCGDSLSGIGGVNRPGIIHRIDKDTSGLVCVAKNDRAHLFLSEQLRDHSMYREYSMIVNGRMREKEGTVDAPIGRHPTDRKKMAVVRDPSKKGRDAVTHWRVIEEYKGFSYLAAVLETGRTHQIRVHMSYIGHPLMGDETYGGGRTAFEKQNRDRTGGQMLHAGALTFTHPDTGESMRVEAELPEDFEYILGKLRKTE